MAYILENDVYCGTLRTHKKKTVSIRGKAIKLPEEEHFVFENHHEAIISKETFNLAQEIRKRKLANNIKARDVKQFIKKILLKINIKLYLKLR